MKKLQLIIILAAATALWGCSNTSKTQFVPLPVLDLVPITQAEVIPSSRFSATTETLLGGDFDFDAFKALRSRQSICLSPFSLGAALSMAAEGASGATAEQMWKVLGKEYSKAPEASTVKVANSVWVNKQISILPDFKKTIQSKYNSEVYNRDFSQKSAVADINRWCSRNTN